MRFEGLLFSGPCVLVYPFNLPENCFLQSSELGLLTKFDKVVLVKVVLNSVESAFKFVSNSGLILEVLFMFLKSFDDFSFFLSIFFGNLRVFAECFFHFNQMSFLNNLELLNLILHSLCSFLHSSLLLWLLFSLLGFFICLLVLTLWFFIILFIVLVLLIFIFGFFYFFCFFLFLFLFLFNLNLHLLINIFNFFLNF